MIAILDTNILISALIYPHSLPGRVATEWSQKRFQLLSSEDQLTEFRRVSRYEKIAARLPKAKAGRLVRRIQRTALFVDRLPVVDLCRDPNDNYLLAMCEVGQPDYLVTGDKIDLIAIGRFRSTAIVAVRQFAEILNL
jgi:putative PIN family toxin of toxin-antitoxin system